jgi:hypothetical protein
MKRNFLLIEILWLIDGMLFELKFLSIVITSYPILTTEKRKNYTNENLFENQVNIFGKVIILNENGFLQALYLVQNNWFVKIELYEESMMILS